MIVWVVESGDYSDRYIGGIYSSLSSAVAGIKRRFDDPRCEPFLSWSELEKEDEGRFFLTASMSQGVVGFCISGDFRHEINAYRVED